MADFIAKLGLDAKDFISGMESAAQKAGIIGKAMTDSAADSTKLADGLKKAGTEADGLAKSTAGIEDNLQKASASGGALDGLTSKFKEGQAAASAGGGMFGEVAGKLGQLATPAGAATAAIGGLTAGIAASINIGQEFQQSLAGVSAITGVTGAGLDDIGNRARDLAKKFGGEANTQLQSFQGVLSRFGAQLADTPDKLGTVSENINILAKAGGIDAAGAMDALTSSMLQFGVDTSNANELASESGRFINVLAASAKVGAAEIPQVAEAVNVAGVAAKGAKVSFEETNAAVQVLAAGGKVGAEAGTALRNVLGKIAGEEVIPKEALNKLKSLGVDMSKVSDTSIPLSERLKELSKASGDATAFAQVFGTENAAAASILANGADTIQDWTKQITGTQEATTQAATNMNTFSEQMKRAQSAVQDLAIGAFQILAPIMATIMKVTMDVAGAIGSVLVGAFNLVAAPINFVAEKLGGWGAIMNALSPVLQVVGAAVGAFTLALNANAIATGISEAATAAWTLITNGASAATAFMSGSMAALNATILANPIALAVAALAALAAGVYLAYQNIEPFRNAVDNLWKLIKDSAVAAFDALTNAIQVAWNWIKQAAGVVVDLYMKFNPLVILFRTAYDNLGFFRTAVDAVVGVIKDMIKFVTDAYDAVVKFFSATSNAEVKVTAKVETKPEETKKQVEDAAKKDPPKIAAKATTKSEQSEKDKLDDILRTTTANLKAEQLIEENKIKQKAIDENRKLTSEEQANVLRSQIALTDKIAEATRKIYETAGEGEKLTLGVKLDEKDRVDVRNKVVTDLDKLSDEKVKLQFQIINLNETVRKESLDYISKTASILKEEGQKRLNVDLFIKNPEQATKAALAKIDELRKASADAAALNDEELSSKLKRQADELAEKLGEVSEKASEKRQKIAEEEAKKAEEQRKKNIEMSIATIENEQARSLALKIFKLSEERRAILRSTDGTEAERLAIARRYQNEIDALKSGKDEGTEREIVKLAKEEAALRSSLANRKVNYEQFNAQILDLEKRKAELEKQIEENKAAAKKAIEEASKGVQEEVQKEVSDGTAVVLNEKGLEIIKDDAIQAFLSIASAGADLKDALKNTFDAVNADLTATFDLVAQKGAKALDFKQFGIIDNAKSLGEILGASFISAETAGKNFADSTQTAVASAQTAIDGALQKRLKNETDAYEAAKKAGKDSYEQVGQIALTTFAIQVNQGKNALTAAKDVAIQTAGTLLETYAIPAIASFLAFLGPFALPVATAAIGLLRSQLQSLGSGFQDGGYTGDGGPSQIAGVVHGQEFVHTADVTRRHRGLFEHLHKGGELSSWMVTTAGSLQAPAMQAPQFNTYGIESRLDRLESAIIRGNKRFESMRAVQMTVQHDPTLTIKAQSRNLEIRSARS